MTDHFVRKGQTGEPTNNVAHFGTRKRTADDVALGLTGPTNDAAGIETAPSYTAGMPNSAATETTSFWDDPEFQKGHLEDIRTEIADRVYQGRNDPLVMEKLYAARADMVKKLRDAGYDTKPAW